MQKIGQRLTEETFEDVKNFYSRELGNDFSRTNRDKAREMDPYGQLSHKKFLRVFHKPTIKDPKERKKRAITLKKNQKEVLKNNKAFLAGDVTWLENTNEFSDITKEDFRSSMLGVIDKNHHPDDKVSERFYRSFYNNRDRTCLPSSYNSVSRGFISPAKNQRIPDDPREYGCGSCVAFATLALVETCFKKKVGKFGDYSEQHLLDCAYKKVEGVNGCKAEFQFYKDTFNARFSFVILEHEKYFEKFN